MGISAGSRLGAYEILSPLGAGGMGEVWRARDTRLARDVAIKVLPAELSTDPTRLRRFEREAQATSALTHPNIVTIYEVAAWEGALFIAMELVEGRTLREVMGGSVMPLRRLLAIAPQIAEGLARAHESGIVHRDLKPENVMVTKDGLVKILDFGLAKLVHPEEDSGQTESGMTVSAVTRPGLAIGTAGYMSPEQASGHPVDFRSDQFSFGSMLYEMATGRPAFKRPTTAQTLAAIIEEEPEPMATVAAATPAPLRWIVARCMAKEPESRYAATRDLVRDLTTLRDHVSELSSSSAIAIEEPRRRPRWRGIAFVLAGAAALAGMLFLGRRLERAGISQPRYRQLTFRGTGIGTARFAPDGQTIVFSSETEGKPPELMSLRLDSPDVRSMGLPPAHVLSISDSGQMAIALLRPYALSQRIGHLAFEQLFYRDRALLCGTLAEVSLSGGTPREIAENVLFAEWAPNSRNLAIVRQHGNANRVESPIGRVIDEREDTWLNHPRFSRRSNRLAFKDWGDLFLYDESDRFRKIVTRDAYEIAWSDATGEIWYSGLSPSGTELHAVTAAGRDRLVTTLPGDFVLYDVSRNGTALLGRVEESSEILGSFPDEPRRRNLTNFDNSIALGLTPGGDTLLFSDAARPLGDDTRLNEQQSYVRKTDGSPPTMIGDGDALSADGRFAFSVSARGVTGGVIVPIGAGETRTLSTGSVEVRFVDWHRSGFFPDGKRTFFSGRERARGWRVWTLSLEDGAMRPITPEGTGSPVLVGDGHFLCARGADLDWYLYPVDDQSAPRKVQGILPGEEPIQSTPDGLLYVRGADELRPGETLITTRVYQLDPSNGKRTLVKEIPPANPRTGGAVLTILFSADGKTCLWTHMRYSTELVLAEGLK
jgi:serine/threonine protein kinase